MWDTSFTTLPGNMLLWSRWFSFMAHLMTVLFLLFCSQLVVGVFGGVVFQTSARGNTSTLSCRNISAGDGYTYPVPSYIPSALLWNKDCEQEWYSEEGEFLSDGRHQANKTKHPLVLNETRKNITVSECIDLHHSVTCHGLNQKFKHTYQVIFTTDTTTTITTTIISGVMLIGLLIGVPICLHKKRRLNNTPLNMEAGNNGESSSLNTPSTEN